MAAMAEVVGRRARAGGVPPAFRSTVWFLAVVVSLVLAWELYKVVGKALEGTVPLPIRPDDTSMPHVWDILGELFTRRSPSEPILLVVLLRESMFTLREALLGFAFGTAVGFGLAVAFSQSRLLERSFMPYVVASQTVPLVAIAPIVVIWGAKIGWPVWVSVAIISAYLVFFPVTINTLRGLRSPDPTVLELMRSYAAGRGQTLWKVQVPAAMPFVFSALKISATASVVGALVGELPSSLNRGLGRALLTFMYTFVTGPEKLFAAILVASSLSLGLVAVIALVEHRVLGHRRLAG
ncbi:MAG TPA: ABC transporter permease [Actinobacteria bacterium]|nr:ABC transporter permease [Actinomycetota bacterium]